MASHNFCTFFYCLQNNFDWTFKVCLPPQKWLSLDLFPVTEKVYPIKFEA